MRLWSLHPKYFDPQGLVALWRESLLAQAVLRGETRGYRNHPQLDRFKVHPSPLVAMSVYLSGIYAEAEARGYKFDASKIRPARERVILSVTSGQLEYEWKHLMAKLRERNPELYRKWQQTEEPETHPLSGFVLEKSRAGSALWHSPRNSLQKGEPELKTLGVSLDKSGKGIGI